MTSVPPQITFRKMAVSPFVRARVRDRTDRLTRHYPRIVNCRVVVEAPHRRHHKGKLYTVVVEMKLPGATLASHRTPDARHAHEDVYVAMRDAFDAADRQLEEHLGRKSPV